jgi:RNA polymerase sigma-70 factor (ECF subfamily)
VIEQILEAHLPHVYRFAYHMLADHHTAQDIAQETMLRAWRHHDSLQDTDNARPWLLKIAANLCRDHLRRSQHPASRTRPIQEQDHPNSLDIPHDSPLIQSEQTEQLLNMMRQLSQRKRQVLYLHAFEQLDHDQIASVLRISSNSVRVNLSQARQDMRNLIDLPQPEARPQP